MGPVVMVGTAVNDRWLGRRRYAAQLREHERQLAGARLRVDEACRQELARLREAHPDPATVLATAQAPGSRLWQRRLGDPDALVVSVGRCRRAASRARDRRRREHRRGPPPAPTRRARCRSATAGPFGVARPTGPGGGCDPLGRRPARRPALAPRPASRPARGHAVLPSRGGAGCARLPHVRDPDGRLRPGSAAAGGIAVGRAVAGLMALVDDRDLGHHRRSRPARRRGARGRRCRPAGRAGPGRPARAGTSRQACTPSSSTATPPGCPWRSPPSSTWPAPEPRRPSPASAGRVEVDEVGDVVGRPPEPVLAPLRDATASTGGQALPATVRLVRAGPTTAGSAPKRWSTAGAPSRPAPRSRWDRTDAGTTRLDLVRDGPHFLVAGTTGSGKSELLRTLVASLAVHNSPSHLSLLLVDYKGGAAFRECADLPHTAGVVTDLDERLAARALASLRAELRRREALVGGCRRRRLRRLRRCSPRRAPAPPGDRHRRVPRPRRGAARLRRPGSSGWPPSAGRWASTSSSRRSGRLAWSRPTSRPTSTAGSPCASATGPTPRTSSSHPSPRRWTPAHRDAPSCAPEAGRCGRSRQRSSRSRRARPPLPSGCGRWTGEAPGRPRDAAATGAAGLRSLVDVVVRGGAARRRTTRRRAPGCRRCRTACPVTSCRSPSAPAHGRHRPGRPARRAVPAARCGRPHAPPVTGASSARPASGRTTALLTACLARGSTRRSARGARCMPSAAAGWRRSRACRTVVRTSTGPTGNACGDLLFRLDGGGPPSTQRAGRLRLRHAGRLAVCGRQRECSSATGRRAPRHRRLGRWWRRRPSRVTTWWTTSCGCCGRADRSGCGRCSPAVEHCCTGRWPRSWGTASSCASPTRPTGHWPVSRCVAASRPATGAGPAPRRTGGPGRPATPVIRLPRRGRPPDGAPPLPGGCAAVQRPRGRAARTGRHRGAGTRRGRRSQRHARPGTARATVARHWSRRQRGVDDAARRGSPAARAGATRGGGRRPSRTARRPALTTPDSPPGATRTRSGDHLHAVHARHPDLCLVVDGADTLQDHPVERALREVAARVDAGGGLVLAGACSTALAGQFRGFAVEVSRHRTGVLLGGGGPGARGRLGAPAPPRRSSPSRAGTPGHPRGHRAVPGGPARRRQQPSATG